MNRGAFWSGLEAVVSAFLSVITSFVIARMIGPAELGIGASAVALHVVLWVVANALFADALVQKADIDDRTLSSAFWASTMVGCAAMAVQAASGFGLAAMLHDQRLVPMAFVLAAPLVLVGSAGAIQGLLTRERAYRSLALRTLIGQGLGTTVGVAAAYAGAGGWAVVCQQAVTSLVGALALLIGRGWRPACVPELVRRHRIAEGRAAADRLDDRADCPVSAVRRADRRHGRRRGPGPGPYRLPPGGHGPRPDVHRAVAADAARAVGAPGRSNQHAGAGRSLAAPDRSAWCSRFARCWPHADAGRGAGHGAELGGWRTGCRSAGRVDGAVGRGVLRQASR